MESKNAGSVTRNDYLYATGRVRALERTLLTRERASRMIEARATEDAVKVLSECGYTDWPSDGKTLPAGWDGFLAADMAASLRMLAAMSPEPQLIEVLSIPYDYHNAKVLLKSTASGAEIPERLLSDAGRVPARRIMELFRTNALRDLPGQLGTAMTEAADHMARTFDPQLGDFVLDRACFADMLSAAQEIGCDYAVNYVRLRIDVANLRAAVRAGRSGHGPELLRLAVIPNGHVDPASVLASASGGTALNELFKNPLLQAAADAAPSAIRRETGLSDFERHCDNAIAAFFAESRMVSFGPEPLLAYAAAREREPVAIRTILSGREAGLTSAEIRSRLRNLPS